MISAILFSVLAFGYSEVPAEYELPVPAELAPYSRFQMKPVEVEVIGDRVKVEYYIPQTITGHENEIEMTGILKAGEDLVLTGPKGNAVCNGVGAGQSCRVKYDNLDLSLELASRELDKLGLSPEDKAGFFQVAARFQESGGDMGGIVHYLAPKSEKAYAPELLGQ